MKKTRYGTNREIRIHRATSRKKAYVGLVVNVPFFCYVLCVGGVRQVPVDVGESDYSSGITAVVSFAFRDRDDFFLGFRMKVSDGDGWVRNMDWSGRI